MLLAWHSLPTGWAQDRPLSRRGLGCQQGHEELGLPVPAVTHPEAPAPQRPPLLRPLQDKELVFRSAGVWFWRRRALTQRNILSSRSTELDSNWAWFQLRCMQVGGNANAVSSPWRPSPFAVPWVTLARAAARVWGPRGPLVQCFGPCEFEALAARRCQCGYRKLTRRWRGSSRAGM